MTTRAYVTLVTNADFAIGAAALLRSLAETGTTADRVVLHTGGVPDASLRALEGRGASLVPVGLLPTSDAFNDRHAKGRLHGLAPFTRGEKPPFHTPLDNFAKLRLWELPHDRAVFLDADTLVVRNIDRLFDYPELSAAPNVYESLADFHRMNSGVFAARPARSTFHRLLAALDMPDAFWRRTDQTFLQWAFPDWHGLPVFDNLLQYVWLNLPALWSWEQVRVVHFQYEKPWQEHGKADALRPLIDLWRAFAGDGPIPDLSALPGPPYGAPMSRMTIALTGASGLVGQFVARAVLAAGHALACLGRPSPWGGEPRPWRLGQPAPLAGCDALIHCAFSHAPGRYRGGEGDDPAGFLAANLDGTLRLWDDAAGLRTVFLSSRAVYDGLPPGTTLTEGLALAPDSLYGRAKLAAEPPGGASLRATGVYGPPAPGRRHKWADLFGTWARGEPVAPSRATEVHGDDVAAAALRLLDAPPGPYNCSDLLLDRRDLLAAWGAAHGVDRPLPPPSDAVVSVMDCAKLRALGWKPGGMERLRQAVRAL